MLTCQKISSLALARTNTNVRLASSVAKGAAAAAADAGPRRSSTRKKKPDYSKLHRKEEKNLREKLLRSEQATSETHVYKNLYPWKGPKELAEHLKNTQVCSVDGLIALNKPYGVAMSTVNTTTDTNKPQSIVQTLSSGSVPPHVPSVRQVLPHLKDLYHVDHLEVVKSSERWSSGLILLSTSEKVTERVQKCLRRSRALSEPAVTYKAVTLGLPVPSAATTRVGAQLEYVHNVGQVPIIVKKFSKNSVSSGKVKSGFVQHRTLAYNEDSDTSLVEVTTQMSKWHFVRVWLAYCYCPALGDHLYSGRVKTLLRRRVQVSPHNVTHESQILPDNLYSALALPLKVSEMVPCHIHRSQVALRQYNSDKTDLLISAPPPDHFLYTCDKLGLSLDKEGEEEDGNVNA